MRRLDTRGMRSVCSKTVLQKSWRSAWKTMWNIPITEVCKILFHLYKKKAFKSCWNTPFSSNASLIASHETHNREPYSSTTFILLIPNGTTFPDVFNKLGASTAGAKIALNSAKCSRIGANGSGTDSHPSFWNLSARYWQTVITSVCATSEHGFSGLKASFRSCVTISRDSNCWSKGETAWIILESTSAAQVTAEGPLSPLKADTSMPTMLIDSIHCPRAEPL
mmetsp:Transcript_20630/g.26088  ORF Transcript_20630/g.26088 Transcript_20630/m.26088 type:complete len:223 (+) Transcript_20630:575-1243(+)